VHVSQLNGCAYCVRVHGDRAEMHVVVREPGQDRQPADVDRRRPVLRPEIVGGADGRDAAAIEEHVLARGRAIANIDDTMPGKKGGPHHAAPPPRHQQSRLLEPLTTATSSSATIAGSYSATPLSCDALAVATSARRHQEAAVSSLHRRAIHLDEPRPSPSSPASRVARSFLVELRTPTSTPPDPPLLPPPPPPRPSPPDLEREGREGGGAAGSGRGRAGRAGEGGGEGRPRRRRRGRRGGGGACPCVEKGRGPCGET